MDIEQRLFFAEQRLFQKRTDKFCDQTEVVERDWRLGISILPVEQKRHIAETRVGDSR